MSSNFSTNVLMSYGKINLSLGLYIEIKLTLVWYNTQIMVLKKCVLTENGMDKECNS